MKIILTGSSGFVGSRVLYYLEKEGHTVISIPSDMLKGEITEKRFQEIRRMIEREQPDVIVHSAAISSTVYSEQHPDESYIANALLPQVMARLASLTGSKLIYFSSDQVYSGCSGTEPHLEKEENLEPGNVYGRHKLEAEKRILDIKPDSVALRLSWMYDMPVYQTKSNNNFVLALLKSAISGKAVTYSLNDFRGITYVRSVAQHLLETFNLPGGVYNFGSENDLNMYDTACAFLSAMGLESKITEILKSTSTQQLKNLRMDCSKIRGHGISFEETADAIIKLTQDYPGLFYN